MDIHIGSAVHGSAQFYNIDYKCCQKIREIAYTLKVTLVMENKNKCHNN